ncbi:hypothetical protein ACNJ7E_16345 [Rhodococcus sp. NM-2]|uniref:hypothetical protein n=1 Tax=Rhodococcus sp. NM-2 TaxID=3401174 RepID=UPI003AAA7588
MSFNAVGVVVMISGPGDTAGEVAIAREVIAKWNSDHSADRGVVFIPKHHSSDTVPVYRRGVDGQAVINEQITEHSDVVLCLFKYRLGTPTPRNEYSGTAEEADLREADARVHMYFWDGDAVPKSVTEGTNREQWDRLNEFRESFYANDKGLFDTYDSDEHLREKLERALWSDARNFQKTRETAKAPAALTSPSATPSITVSVTEDVWRVPEAILGRFLEDLISNDIREEQEFAASYGDRTDPRFEAALATTRGYVRRDPKTAAQIDEWAHGVRARLRSFDREVASSAALPIEILLNTDRRLEGVEVELVFEEVVGVEATTRTMSDIWTPLHVPPKPETSPHADVSASWPDVPDWTQDGNDVVMIVDAGELRIRRLPVPRLSSLVLMVPCTVPAPAPSEIKYTWRVTAANIDQTLAGEGTIPVMTDGDRALARWWAQSERR